MQTHLVATALALSTTVASCNAWDVSLVHVADVDLPGEPVRFDYQDLDTALGRLVIAHMDDASVVVVSAKDGALIKVVPDVPTARGVAVASDVGRVFVTSSPDKLVILDSADYTVLKRVDTGQAPDGVAWDPAHHVVGVSDQGDGALSLIADAGDGARTQVKLGDETGNAVFDAGRGVFWVAVHNAVGDQIIAVDPVAAMRGTAIALPGCEGAHGLRLHPDGASALVACEINATIARVDLATMKHAITLADTGDGPDVLAIDAGRGYLYVAAESGDLTIFDIHRPGLVVVDRESPGPASHSVAVDPSTGHVFFPLEEGPAGTPVLRIMRPSGG